MRTEMLFHPATEDLVLLTQPTPAVHRLPGNGDAPGDYLLRTELLAREVDLDPHAHTVPPVVVGEFTIDSDLAPDQLAAEEIVEDHRGDAALAPSRIARTPARPTLRRTCIGAPTAANSGFDVRKE